MCEAAWYVGNASVACGGQVEQGLADRALRIEIVLAVGNLRETGYRVCSQAETLVAILTLVLVVYEAVWYVQDALLRTESDVVSNFTLGADAIALGYAIFDYREALGLGVRKVEVIVAFRTLGVGVLAAVDDIDKA